MTDASDEQNTPTLMEQMVGRVRGGSTAGGERPPASTADRATVDRISKGWGNIPRMAARKTMEKHGRPNEATPSRLIWCENGPWKRTMEGTLRQLPSA